MSRDTGISWTSHTWNPVVGCAKVSPGCRHCYAARAAHRLGHNPGPGFAPYAGLAHPLGPGEYNWTGAVRCLPDRLADPLGWADAGPVFVNSMSDLFHPGVPERFVRRVFGVMLLASWHPFQVLTKRPDRLLALAPRLPWPANVWAGVSVESQDYAWRVDLLRRVPARVRFVSAEPLLGPVELDLSGVDWVITGGESGPGHRPLDPAWARAVRDQCMAAGVAFFHKQNGGPTPTAGGRLLDGREYDGMPAHAARPVPPAAERRRLRAAVTGAAGRPARVPLPVV